MDRKATNKLLHKAKKSKSDEFYSQLCDIESELQHYKAHFKNKVVYCNCDDPRISNFFKQIVYKNIIVTYINCKKRKYSDLTKMIENKTATISSSPIRKTAFLVDMVPLGNGL